jgi:hypothetical protein
MRRKHTRAQHIADRRYRARAIIPESYRKLAAISGPHLGPAELVEILTKARTVASVQDNPDGWIMLDTFIESVTLAVEVHRILGLDDDDGDIL